MCMSVRTEIVLFVRIYSIGSSVQELQDMTVNDSNTRKERLFFPLLELKSPEKLQDQQWLFRLLSWI